LRIRGRRDGFCCHGKPRLGRRKYTESQEPLQVFITRNFRRSSVKNDTAISQAGSVCDFVVASVAAGFTIVESVLAEADLHLGLAQAAVALALAAVFRHLALHAAILVFGGGGHGGTVAPGWVQGKCRW
jgi:hypothetical protein